MLSGFLQRKKRILFKYLIVFELIRQSVIENIFKKTIIGRKDRQVYVQRPTVNMIIFGSNLTDRLRWLENIISFKCNV